MFTYMMGKPPGGIKLPSGLIVPFRGADDSGSVTGYVDAYDTQNAWDNPGNAAKSMTIVRMVLIMME